jgi:hypothetical protein
MSTTALQAPQATKSKERYNSAQEEVIARRVRNLRDGIQSHRASELDMLIHIPSEVTPVKITGRIEIARSFSYKLNVGNYESRDFFMSQKAECEECEAEKVSEALHRFCKEQVLKAVAEYRQGMGSK